MEEEEMGALVAELRRRLFAEKRGAMESGKYAAEDVRRLREDDSWLRQFLRRCDGDLDVTLPLFAETLKWRQEFGVRRLSEEGLRSVFLRQAMYIHGSDKNGTPLLWFNVRHQKKDEEEVRQLLVYWLEYHNRKANGDPLVIIFDMSSTGLQNMDLDLVKFLLHCLKFHFPGLLDYLLVYEIPWILNAAWKLVKSWLDPAAQKKIIFVSKASIKEYIAPDNLPLHIGGSDDYRVSMEDLGAMALESGERGQQSNGRGTSSQSPKPPKSVKFADGRSGSESEEEGEEEQRIQSRPGLEEAEEETPRNGPLLLNGGTKALAAHSGPALTLKTATHTSSPSPVSPSSPSPSGSAPPKAKFGVSASQRVGEMAAWRLGDADSFHEGPLLSIDPKDSLLLQSVPGEQDRVEAIVLRNPHPTRIVAFKVKITSPERFRVRPSMGVVKPSTHTIVKIYLQPGHDATVGKDKFLVQSIPLEEEPENNDSLGELWKASNSDNIVEHRLKCRLDGEMAESAETPTGDGLAPKDVRPSSAAGSSSLRSASERERIGSGVVAELRSEMSERDRVVKILLVLLLSLIVVLFVHQRLVLADIQSQLNEAKALSSSSSTAESSTLPPNQDL